MTAQTYAWAWMRRLIWDRDGGRCRLCGEPVDFSEMEVDHVVPVKLGGPDDLLNFQTAHAACNRRKGPPATYTPRARRGPKTAAAKQAPDDRLLTVEEVAERLRVHPETVRRMLRTGELRGSQPVSRRAGWRIPSSEVERLLRR